MLTNAEEAVSIKEPLVLDSSVFIAAMPGKVVMPLTSESE